MRRHQAAVRVAPSNQRFQSLDVDMAHGLAPDANVLYVGANSCNDNDLLAAEAYVVDNHAADVVSNSWGTIMHTSDQGDQDPATQVTPC